MVLKGTSFLLGGSYHPFMGRVCSQVAGVEAQRVRFELALFSINVYFFSSPCAVTFSPKEWSAETSETYMLTEA